MFESLGDGWKPKDVRNGLVGLAALGIFVSAAIFAPDDGLQLGVALKGVVVSSGPVNVSRACGGTREIAAVKLASGRIIQASVVPTSPLSAGTKVVVRKQLVVCGQTNYEVDFPK